MPDFLRDTFVISSAVEKSLSRLGRIRTCELKPEQENHHV